MDVNPCVELLQAIDNSSSSIYDNVAYGYLFLDLTEAPHSLTNVKDIGSLEYGTLLGNIGGMIVPQINIEFVRGRFKAICSFAAV